MQQPSSVASIQHAAAVERNHMVASHEAAVAAANAATAAEAPVEAARQRAMAASAAALAAAATERGAARVPEVTTFSEQLQAVAATPPMGCIGTACTA